MSEEKKSRISQNELGDNFANRVPSMKNLTIKKTIFLNNTHFEGERFFFKFI